MTEQRWQINPFDLLFVLEKYAGIDHNQYTTYCRQALENGDLTGATLDKLSRLHSVTTEFEDELTSLRSTKTLLHSKSAHNLHNGNK